MAERVRLRCAALDITLRLPVWPQDVSITLPGWNVTPLERNGRPAYDLPTTVTTEERSLGFTLRNEDYYESVQPMIQQLRAMSAAKFAPVQLLMGDHDTGLWRLEPPQVTVIDHADDGTPSVVDVSLVLKRASEAIVRVGPVKRVKGRGRGFATKG